MPKLGQLYRTLRRLKATQLFYQLYYRLCRYAWWQKPKACIGEFNVHAAWPAGLRITPPSGQDACLDREQWAFRFVGLEHRFGEQVDWSGCDHGKLWNYNLHYFEWLWGMEPADAKAVVLDWIERYPFTRHAEGWEPYPLSLRVINWIAYWGSFGADAFAEDTHFRKTLLGSLSLQCDWLTQRLEKHLLGNHYLENGAALWVAGRFFEHTQASEWLAQGQAILNEQLEEQILSDGMHFERSPMYHNRLLWLLEILSKIDASLYQQNYQQAKAAALRLQHPDGQIALFNDSAFGIYPEAVGKPPVGVFAMEASGYYGMRNGDGTYLVCDAGRIGPDYILGHAHCDIGSFELSIRGKRFITDTGVFHYETSDQRHYARSTEAHNTFGPVDVEQAEIWASFRVGDRPEVRVREWSVDGDRISLELSHDGFARALRQPVQSERILVFSGRSSLVVADCFESSETRDWEGRLHFAPGVEVIDLSGSRVWLRFGNERVSVTLEGVDQIAVRETPYWPEFNFQQDRQTLVYSRAARSGQVKAVIDWNVGS